MKNITICVLSCGEETEKECLSAISPWLGKVEFLHIRNVCPQAKALNLMIENVKTEYLVEIDADMVLNPDAYERIKFAVDKYHHDGSWHSILFNLRDTLTEKDILALKILRTRVMKENLFGDSPTPDVEHFGRLKEAGYGAITTFLGRGVIGKHVVKGKYFCFSKYKDVYVSIRKHGWEWDSGVFMGGETILEKAKAHFNFFLRKWLETSNVDYLYCIAGMTEGLIEPLEDRSKRLDGEIYIKKEEILDRYFHEWYLPQMAKISSFL